MHSHGNLVYGTARHTFSDYQLNCWIGDMYMRVCRPTVTAPPNWASVRCNRQNSTSFRSRLAWSPASSYSKLVIPKCKPEVMNYKFTSWHPFFISIDHQQVHVYYSILLYLLRRYNCNWVGIKAHTFTHSLLFFCFVHIKANITRSFLLDQHTMVFTCYRIPVLERSAYISSTNSYRNDWYSTKRTYTWRGMIFFFYLVTE